MAFDPTTLEDGDSATVTKIIDTFDAAKTAVDDLSHLESMRRGAINHVQTGPLWPTNGGALVVANDDDVQAYPQATFLASVTYNAYGDDGGSDEAANLNTGDRAIVGHPSCAGYAGEKAELTFNGGTGWLVGENLADRVTGILVLFNGNVHDVVQNGTAREIMFCIQYKLDSSATWWTIDETESFVSHSDHVTDPTTTEDLDYDVPIATLIDTAVIDENGAPATDRITGVRAMVSMRTAAVGTTFSIDRWNLTAIPIFAKRTVL